MVAADVAVARQPAVLIRCAVLEDFQVGAIATADHLEVPDDRPWMHIEVVLHPVILETEFAEPEIRLAAEDIDKEGHGFGQVRHGDADVLQTTHARQRAVRKVSVGHEALQTGCCCSKSGSAQRPRFSSTTDATHQAVDFVEFITLSQPQVCKGTYRCKALRAGPARD
ncbi:hypothetical protein FQZ97_840270 [compost metagenome]